MVPFPSEFHSHFRQCRRSDIGGFLACRFRLCRLSDIAGNRSANWIDLIGVDLKSNVFHMFRNHSGFSLCWSMIFPFRFSYIFADVDFSSNFF